MCHYTTLKAAEERSCAPQRLWSSICFALQLALSQVQTERNLSLSSESRDSLGDLLPYRISRGCLFHFICTAVKDTVMPTVRFFVCVCVCDWLGPGSWLWVCLCVCVFAVKVCEPDGGCGQKERIAKVHITVTLCFLHDKNCLSFPPFALTLPSPPQLLPLTPPSHLSSFPVRGHSSPTVAAGLSHCYSTPYLCHPFNFRLTPFLSLSFVLPLPSPWLCLRTSPSSFSFSSSDRQHFSVISLSPAAFLYSSQSKRVKYKWAVACHLFWFFIPDVRVFHHKPRVPKLSVKSPTHLLTNRHARHIKFYSKRLYIGL